MFLYQCFNEIIRPAYPFLDGLQGRKVSINESRIILACRTSKVISDPPEFLDSRFEGNEIESVSLKQSITERYFRLPAEGFARGKLLKQFTVVFQAVELKF